MVMGASRAHGHVRVVPFPSQIPLNSIEIYLFSHDGPNVSCRLYNILLSDFPALLLFPSNPFSKHSLSNHHIPPLVTAFWWLCIVRKIK